MISMTVKAGELALKEMEQGRSTVIMFQNDMACAVFEMGAPPTGIKLLFFDSYFEHYPQNFDTLITVGLDDGPDNADFALKLLKGAKPHLRQTPKWIRIERYKDGKPTPDVTLEGDEIWK